MMIVRRLLEPGEFSNWEERFKARAETRRAAGCQGVRYFRSLDNEDEVVMIFDWQERAQGQSFLDAMLAQFPQLDRSASGGGRAALDYMFAQEMSPLEN